jgi:integrase
LPFTPLKDRKKGSLFPAERGDGHYQGTRNVWVEVTKLAGLPGVRPHTLRRTLGSTATSSGDALAVRGAILGHANLRPTVVYAHVHRDASIEATKRVEKLPATALEGKAAEAKDGQTPGAVANLDADLIRVLAARLSKRRS